MKPRHVKEVSWGICCASLSVLFLYFSACTQGQGPGEGSNSSALETAGGDVCEGRENLNNILCQWVATEFNTVAGSDPMKTTFGYDDQGRVIELGTFKGGHKSGIYKITYGEHGVSQLEALSSPDPVESEHFTAKDTTTTVYQDGSVTSTRRQGELLDATTKAWTPNSSTETSYDYTTPNKIVMTAVDYDASIPPIPSSAERHEITKDSSGKTESIDVRQGQWNTINIPNNIDPLNSWTIYSYDYYSNGRMKTWTKKEKSCSTNCDTTKPMMAPDEVKVTSIAYDGQDRLSGFTETRDGVSSGECTAKYEIQTQAKIAGKQHALSFLVLIGGNAVEDPGFNDRDIFSAITCELGGESQAVTVKWVRLWEALPNGKPPGS